MPRPGGRMENARAGRYSGPGGLHVRPAQPHVRPAQPGTPPVDNRVASQEAVYSRAATSRGTNFNGLILLDQRATAGETVLHTPEEYSELLGRPDIVNGWFYFSDVAGPAQAVVHFESSFDGIHYGLISTLPPFTVTNGTVVKLSTFGSIPLTMVRGAVEMWSGSAQVRASFTSSERGRRRFAATVLDCVLEGTSSYYSESQYNDLLGSTDDLYAVAFADQVQGSSVVLTVLIEESPDGIVWTVKPEFPQFIFTTLPLPQPQDGTLSAATGFHCSQFVRFHAFLAGTNPSAKLRLCVVGRGQ
jgi:hypothetical protein